MHMYISCKLLIGWAIVNNFDLLSPLYAHMYKFNGATNAFYI
jgi:hypothetical protein